MSFHKFCYLIKLGIFYRVEGVRIRIKSMLDAGWGFFVTLGTFCSISGASVISLSAAWAMAGTLRILTLFRRKLSKSTGSRAKGSL